MCPCTLVSEALPCKLPSSLANPREHRLWPGRARGRGGQRAAVQASPESLTTTNKGPLRKDYFLVLSTAYGYSAPLVTRTETHQNTSQRRGLFPRFPRAHVPTRPTLNGVFPDALSAHGGRPPRPGRRGPGTASSFCEVQRGSPLRGPRCGRGPWGGGAR